MTRRKFLAGLDSARVEAAIAQAEAASAIEVRVSIAGAFWGDPDELAGRAFERLQMTDTRQRNGILVLIVPWRRRVVIRADAGITAKVDPSLWSAAIVTITAAFRDGKFTEGLVAAVAHLGAVLAPHFPPTARANELSDRLDR